MRKNSLNNRHGDFCFWELELARSRSEPVNFADSDSDSDSGKNNRLRPTPTPAPTPTPQPCLRYLKLCKEHQGKMPCYMPQTNVGSVNWNGARKALKLNQGLGGLQLLPHPRTMTSSSKGWWRINDCQLVREQPGWVSHRSESETFWPKSSVWGWCHHNGSLTFWAENWSAVVGHMRR